MMHLPPPSSQLLAVVEFLVRAKRLIAAAFDSSKTRLLLAFSLVFLLSACAEMPLSNFNDPFAQTETNAQGQSVEPV